MNKICSFDTYASFSDERLAILAQQGKNSALDYLLDKYRAFVRRKSLSYYIIGADRDDIIQEGMIGLFKAVRDFRPGRNVSFKTFADLCVTRQILTAVKNATRQKHAPLNFYVSLNTPLSDDGNDNSTLFDVIGSNKVANPEEIVINKEIADNLGVKMNQVLSNFEFLVLSLYLKGNSYIKIGEAIGKDPKSVDNALQRIKKKIEKLSASAAE